MASKKAKRKYYKVVRQFTYKGKLREVGTRISLSLEQKESLINKNLIKS